jgi:hypothetical protein
VALDDDDEGRSTSLLWTVFPTSTESILAFLYDVLLNDCTLTHQ